MPDALTILTPLVGQAIPSRGSEVLPAGRNPFSSHMEPKAGEGALQLLGQEDAALAVPDTSAGSETPEFVDLPATRKGLLDRAARGCVGHRATPATEPGMRDRFQVGQNGNNPVQQVGEGDERRADDKTRAAAPKGAENGQDARNPSTGRAISEQLQVQTRAANVPTTAGPEATKAFANGHAEYKTSREHSIPGGAHILQAHAIGTTEPRSDDTLRMAPGLAISKRMEIGTLQSSGGAPATRARVPKAPTGGVSGTSSGMAGEEISRRLSLQGGEHANISQQGVERVKTAWFHHSESFGPHAQADSHGTRTGGTLSEGLTSIETRKAGVFVSTISARLDAQNAAGDIMAQPIGTAAPRGKADLTIIEREIADVAVSTPLGAARGTVITAPITPMELPRQIATQLANAMPQAGAGQVEISLNPQELGRVRISLSAQDTGLSVAIMADRGETLDLMRRHIDQLAQEFRDLGYGDVSFSFGQSGDGQLQKDSQAGGSHSMDLDKEGSVIKPGVSVHGSVSAAAGLDLRI